MAYGNWGAFVYRNGERMTNYEDQTPYQEDEIQSGYWQAFGRQDGLRPQHAVLGSGRVRLCGYKHYAILFLDGEWVEDIKKYATSCEEKDESLIQCEGEIEGYKFSFSQFDDPCGINLELIEPDGTKWTSRCGYCIGAGHED